MHGTQKWFVKTNHSHGHSLLDGMGLDCITVFFIKTKTSFNTENCWQRRHTFHSYSIFLGSFIDNSKTSFTSLRKGVAE